MLKNRKYQPLKVLLPGNSEKKWKKYRDFVLYTDKNSIFAVYWYKRRKQEDIRKKYKEVQEVTYDN